MNAAAVSLWLDKVTQPEHPYYHHFQIGLFAGCSYIGTACLTRIPPKKAALFTALAYSISQWVAPLFAQLLESYQDVTLAPLIGQVLHISVTLILSKVICRIVGQSLSFEEIYQISLSCLVSLFVVRLAIRKFRQNIQA